MKMSENLKVHTCTCIFGILAGVSTHNCVLLAWPTNKLSYDRSHSIYLNPTSPEEIFNVIRTIKSSRSCGPDNISNELLRRKNLQYVHLYRA